MVITNPVRSSFVSQFAVPSVSAEKRAAIAGLARRLLDVRGAGESVPALEGELNRRVYGLFGVSKAEIRVIEGEK